MSELLVLVERSCSTFEHLIKKEAKVGSGEKKSKNLRLPLKKMSVASDNIKILCHEFEKVDVGNVVVLCKRIFST